MCTSTLMFVLNTTQPLFVLKPIHTTRQQASLTSCHTPSGATLCHTCSGHAVQVSDSAEEVVHSHEAVLSQVRWNMSATSWLHMCLSWSGFPKGPPPPQNRFFPHPWSH